MSSSPGHLNLPNAITGLRILACPVIFVLAVSGGILAPLGAFALFLVAALSDLWDGYLARKYDLVTNVGKLLDPLADKLLMLSTFVPFYIVSHRPGVANDVPGWGPLPLWVLIVIFGRELAVTAFRAWAARRGVVIAAGTSGKYKALMQALFAGGLLLWYPLSSMAALRGWETSRLWWGWSFFHRGWIMVTLALALVLTIYSLLDYMWSYRSLVGYRH